MFPPRDLGEWLALALIGVVSVSVITGFVLIGGPGAARAEKQDQARLEAVARLAHGLACYRQTVGPLPPKLEGVRAALETPTSAVRLAENCSQARWSVDPVTGDDFEVEAATNETARICAVFARSHAGTGNDYGYIYGGEASLLDADAPRPDAGRFCYTAKLVKSHG